MTDKILGFCDLSISKKFDLSKLHTLEKLGYHTVAINTHVEESSDEPKHKKKKTDAKDKKEFIPAPIEIPKTITDSTKLNILQRITIEFSDCSITHKLNQSDNLKKYDIVAVLPKSLQAFQYVCSTLDADIITFEPESRLPFKISRKLYSQAVDRGIFFELMYSPAIKDSTSRKNVICNAHTFHTIGKSRNIIVTSSAETPMQVRDVHDVINLGFLFGLSSNQSLEVVRNNARRLILKAEGRKCGKQHLKISTNEINEAMDQ